jgi:hypothetical protein
VRRAVTPEKVSTRRWQARQGRRATGKTGRPPPFACPSRTSTKELSSLSLLARLFAAAQSAESSFLLLRETSTPLTQRTPSFVKTEEPKNESESEDEEDEATEERV